MEKSIQKVASMLQPDVLVENVFAFAPVSVNLELVEKGG